SCAVERPRPARSVHGRSCIDNIRADTMAPGVRMCPAARWIAQVDLNQGAIRWHGRTSRRLNREIVNEQYPQTMDCPRNPAGLVVRRTAVVRLGDLPRRATGARTRRHRTG